MTRVAIVVQRYGDNMVGGAESLCMQIAEKLAEQLHWSVTVYTSCAANYTSWANTFPAGESAIRGIKIKRFPVLFPRSRLLFGLFKRLFTGIIRRWNQAGPVWRWLAYRLEKVWIVLQGPYCPSLVRALKKEQGQYDRWIFFTYLYYPTLSGSQVMRNPFALVPTAHDEVPFYFQHTAQLLLRSDAVLVNVQPEQALIETRLGRRLSSIRTAGLGFAVEPQPGPQKADLPFQGPYLLFLGRQSKGKGVENLVQNFLGFLEHYPETELNLILLGQRDEGFPLPTSPRIHNLGFVSQAEKNAILQGALCIINPSTMESLSMIAIEAMMHRKPLLLNRHSAVLDYYCTENPSCFGYRNAEEFYQQLNKIVRTDWQEEAASAHLEATRTWAARHYSWDAVLGIYRGLV